MERTYLAIDLKSFYASCECADKKLDPLTTMLAVADETRTDKTICLAVSPALKAYGIPGRLRLFELKEAVRRVNADRKAKNHGQDFTGSASDAKDLAADPSLALDVIIAPPHMARYMALSGKIYGIYLKYVAPEDIHVYSIDEVLMDVTSYLGPLSMTGQELASRMVRDIYQETGITATCGMGTNLYLAKAAMDILAKHAEPDESGMRFAALTEKTYREKLWSHRPLTDFWRVGKGIAKRLEKAGLFTMGDIARRSIGTSTDYYNEELLYRMFGINAELLIDHAWGWEPVTIADIKACHPRKESVGAGQVLSCGRSGDKARLIVREMADSLSMELFEKKLVTKDLSMAIGYEKVEGYTGATHVDHYGRVVPRHSVGAEHLSGYTSSPAKLMEGFTRLYERIENPNLMVRRLSLVCEHVIPADEAPEDAPRQLDLFTDFHLQEEKDKKEKEKDRKQEKLQEAMASIRSRYGNNALVRGMDLLDDATGMERNNQIGGHKA